MGLIFINKLIINFAITVKYLKNNKKSESLYFNFNIIRWILKVNNSIIYLCQDKINNSLLIKNIIFYIKFKINISI